MKQLHNGVFVMCATCSSPSTTCACRPAPSRPHHRRRPRERRPLHQHRSAPPARLPRPLAHQQRRPLPRPPAHPAPSLPTAAPTAAPAGTPTSAPSAPTAAPTAAPAGTPTAAPTVIPATCPSGGTINTFEQDTVRVSSTSALPSLSHSFSRVWQAGRWESRGHLCFAILSRECGNSSMLQCKAGSSASRYTPTSAAQLGKLLNLAPITLGGLTPALGVSPLNLVNLLGPQFVGAHASCSC